MMVLAISMSSYSTGYCQCFILVAISCILVKQVTYPAWKLPLTYIGIIEVNCINISCDFLPLTTCSKLLPSFLYSKSLSFLSSDTLEVVIK